jgi:hypothetical protein
MGTMLRIGKTIQYFVPIVPIVPIVLFVISP